MSHPTQNTTTHHTACESQTRIAACVRAESCGETSNVERPHLLLLNTKVPRRATNPFFRPRAKTRARHTSWD
eukprot:8009430-Lingulodinium_polyedra.AAC.1